MCVKVFVWPMQHPVCVCILAKVESSHTNTPSNCMFPYARNGWKASSPTSTIPLADDMTWVHSIVCWQNQVNTGARSVFQQVSLRLSELSHVLVMGALTSPLKWQSDNEKPSWQQRAGAALLQPAFTYAWPGLSLNWIPGLQNSELGGLDWGERVCKAVGFCLCCCGLGYSLQIAKHCNQDGEKVL